MEDQPANDPVAGYLKEVSEVKPLTKDEEAQLFQGLAGSRNWDEARENIARRLIEGHLAQVVSIAKGHSASGVPLLELIQEGNRGLMHAVKSFAEKQTGDFTEHAAVCIEAAIRRALP
jgi:RNA polymerase primary sigma factor